MSDFDDISLDTFRKVLLSKNDFHFKKKWGQNFLSNKTILNNITKAAALTKDDFVVEIGPGSGFLTEVMSEKAGLVLAIEIDGTLCTILTELFKDFDNVTVWQGDALKFTFEQIIAFGAERGFTEPFKIVANLPYYITTPLMFHFLEGSDAWQSMTVMVQKEVAERIIAPPKTKDYGALTLAVAYDADPKIAFKVPASAFYPKPNVDSAVLHLLRRKEPPVPVNDKQKFKKIVKAAFAQRRKTINNALTNGLGLEKEKILALLKDADIDPTRRGETLTFGEFATLANLWS